MKDRIKQIRLARNMTMEEFGHHIGIQKSAVSKLENGTSNASEQTILLICDRFGISRQWLETGEGERLKSSPSDQLIPQLQQILARYPAVARAMGQAVTVMTEADFQRLNEIIDLCTQKEQP